MIDDIKAAGIIVREFGIPLYRCKRRKTKTHTRYLEHADVWTNPTDRYGDLRLTVPGERADHHAAWLKVMEIGKIHNIDVHPGMCTIEG